MKMYASRTRTKRNIAAIKDAGWGWIIGPIDCGGPEPEGMSYGIDNAAWPEFQTGEPWDADAFVRVVDRYGAGADFIVVPDVVGDRERSLARTREWLPVLQARPDLAGVRLLIAVQDGMTFADVEPFLDDPRVGIFIGGTTEWKERAILVWGPWAKERGLYVHCGRVNSARRIALCNAGKVDSGDGTSGTKYAKTVPMLEQATRQPDLLTGEAA